MTIPQTKLPRKPPCYSSTKVEDLIQLPWMSTVSGLEPKLRIPTRPSRQTPPRSGHRPRTANSCRLQAQVYFLGFTRQAGCQSPRSGESEYTADRCGVPGFFGKFIST